MNSLKKYIFYSLILTLILFQSATHGFGSKTIQIGPNPQNDLSHEEAHKNFPHIRPDQTGFILYDLSNNRVVAAHNRNQLFIPASTTKILTVAASLHLLGPEHQFKTILSRSGSIHQGVLKGNLYLTGGGDPDLGINDLLQMIREMKQKGIRKVDGKFIFDNSRYEESHEIDEIMDDEAAYNTGISALSLGTNNLIAFWKKSSYRGPTNFFLIPSLSMNEVRNKKYKKKENIESEYIGENNREIWMLSPRNANSGLKFLPVKNPSLFTAQVFKKLSEIEGISLPQPEKGRTPWHSFSIHQVKSRTVLEISRTILATSNNTMTENLLLSLAAERGIQNPNLDSASSYLTEFLRGLPGDTDWNGFSIQNGSGLTSENRISPEQLLAGVLFSSQISDDEFNFEELLPVSGWSSILRTRLNDPETAFRIHAKNGGIFYAMSLAGYLYADSGKKYAFAFMISDYDSRLAYEKTNNKKDRKVRSKIFSWRKLNQDFMDETLKMWIKKF